MKPAAPCSQRCLGSGATARRRTNRVPQVVRGDQPLSGRPRRAVADGLTRGRLPPDRGRGGRPTRQTWSRHADVGTIGEQFVGAVDRDRGLGCRAASRTCRTFSTPTVSSVGECSTRSGRCSPPACRGEGVHNVFRVRRGTDRGHRRGLGHPVRGAVPGLHGAVGCRHSCCAAVVGAPAVLRRFPSRAISGSSNRHRAAITMATRRTAATRPPDRASSPTPMAGPPSPT